MFSKFLRDHTVCHGLKQTKCPAVKEHTRIPLLEIQNNFYNRFAFPNKHQELSFRRDFLWEFGEQFGLPGI